MLALITKTIRQNRTTILVYIIISALLMWMYVAFFPSMLEESEKFSEAFSAYPDDIFKAFGVDIETIFMSMEGFIAAENFSILWPIMVIILTTMLGGSAIAGEIDKGTIEVLLSQPVSRLKIYFSKFIAGVSVILIFTLGSIFSIVPFALLHDVKIDLSAYVNVSIIGFLFGLTIFSLSTMFSSMLSSRGKTASLTAGMMIVFYALNLISSFKESVENIKYLSLFYYYDYSAALLENKVSLQNVSVFLGISIVCVVMGAVIFEKRDVAA